MFQILGEKNKQNSTNQGNKSNSIWSSIGLIVSDIDKTIVVPDIFFEIISISFIIQLIILSFFVFITYVNFYLY